MSVSSSISDGEVKTDERSPGTANVEGSAWSPFPHTVYTVLWLATVLSNTGSWMQNAAAGWLMTSLRPDPFEVALVQAATTLPMFLFSLPAGALADIIDRRLLGDRPRQFAFI
jgi:MFS family permease